MIIIEFFYHVSSYYSMRITKDKRSTILQLPYRKTQMSHRRLSFIGHIFGACLEIIPFEEVQKTYQFYRYFLDKMRTKYMLLTKSEGQVSQGYMSQLFQDGNKSPILFHIAKLPADLICPVHARPRYQQLAH